jgi:2-iminobutanoate/2-iminopropanoate deaminase
MIERNKTQRGVNLASKQRISTNHAPAAMGPYSQGIRSGNLLFTAGQVGLDPATGKLVEGGIQEQTRRVLDNVSAILEAAGASFDDVVKTTVFLSDIANFAAMNEIYKQYFGSDSPPARSTVQVAALPLGALVEIETMAVLGD